MSGEKQRLLSDSSGDGEEDAKTCSPPANGGGASRSKRERLQRNPSLEKVDEDVEKEKDNIALHPEKKSCSDYFGVKSYLHNFYEQHVYKDPDVYEDDDLRYLLHPPNRRRRCTSIWWKVFVWIGANFLIFGIIGVLVGYLVPQKPIIVGNIGDNVKIIDHGAIAFNFNLDVCKLVGLVLFCVGGLTLTVSLLFPSFLYNYCDEDRDRRGEGCLGVNLSDEETPLPCNPSQMTVPATPQITEVQPERKPQEAIFTQEGLIPYKD